MSWIWNENSQGQVAEPSPTGFLTLGAKWVSVSLSHLSRAVSRGGARAWVSQ